MKQQNSLLSRITIDQKLRGGKPCIYGTRITVEDVLSYLASGMTFDEFLNDFPQVQKDDILACFAYCLNVLNDVK